MPNPFESSIGTLGSALGKRLPGPASDWPAPDLSYYWLQ